VDTLTGAAGAAIDLGSGLLTVGKSNGSAMYSGAIAGVGGALKKVGTGVQTLKGASTFTGATAIDAGALNVRVSSALGTVAGAVTVAKDAALELQKETLDVTVGAKGLTISGIGISGAGALRSISGNNSWGGTITLADSARIAVDAHQLALTHAESVKGTVEDLELYAADTAKGIVGGAINTGTGKVTKLGLGEWVLEAKDSFTGEVEVQAGRLRIKADEALGSTAAGTKVKDGAALILDGGVNLGNEVLTLAGKGTSALEGALCAVEGIAETSGQIRLEAETNVRHGNALGTTAGGTVVAFGAALEVQGGIAVGAEALSVSGAGPEGMGGLRSTAGVNSWSGGISLTGDATFGIDAGSLAIRGAPSAVSGTGTSSLTKVGDGTLLLEGSMAASVPHLWAKQGTFQYGAGGAIAATGIVNVDGGTFSLQGYSDSVGGVTLFGGTITSTTGILTSATTYDFRNGVCDAPLAGTVGITKTTGGTVTLGPNAPSTFAGTVAVDEGVLNVRHGSALGNTASGTQVAAGAAVEVQGNTAVGAEPLTLRGDGVAGTGALRSASGVNSWAGTVTLAANAAIQCDADSLTLAGPAGIAGTNTALALQGGGDGIIQGPVATGNATATKLGTGTWTLQGANSYTGATLVGAGTLAFDHPGLNTLSSATIAAAGAAATLRQLQGTVNVSGNVDDGGGASHLSVDNGAMTVNGNLDVDNLTVGFDDGIGTLTVLGAVQVGGSGILDGGRRTGGPGAVPFTSGTLDLTLASSVNAAMDDIRVATQAAGPVPVHGTLKLASTGMNTLTAERIVVADSTAAGNSFATGTLNFGTINCVNSGSFTIAGRQGAPGLTTTGVADILPGGVLDVGNPGGPGPAVDLYLGDNRIESGGFSLGTLDMTGGWVDVGIAPPGDLVFTGGELRDLGGYVGSLRQDGGVLGVGPLPTLTSIGGNYALNGGVAEIGILSPALTPGVDFTQVNVGGTALLDGTVLPLLLDSGTVPSLTSLDVLTASQISLGPAFAVDWSALVLSSGYSGSYAVISGGNLDILRLTIVPEPHDLLLLALVVMAAACPVRRRGQ
jgi:autotransporter-associated beta strand protein